MIGCSRVGSLGNTTPLSEIRAMLKDAVSAGVLHFDTADIYGQGDSERELGRLQRANPDIPLDIVTKAGFRLGKKAKIVGFFKPVLRPLMHVKVAKTGMRRVRSGLDDQDFSPDYLFECVNASLGRLGLSQLPGLLLHDPSKDVLENATTGQFLTSLRQSGIARAVGISLKDETSLLAALASGPISLLQLPITVYERIQKMGLAEEIRERDIFVSVRQILNRPDGKSTSLEAALPPLLADPLVGAVIVGVSKRHHLAAILQSIR
jgi:aryl-alcohol dehydrogenase-like predicted oxidoreductase